MSVYLDYVSLICWSVAYILIIIKSFKDRTYGVPFFSLAFNFAWEINRYRLEMYSMISLSSILIFAWAALDAVIVFTFFKFAFNYTSPAPPRIFTKFKKFSKNTYLLFAALFLIFFIIIMYFIFEYHGNLVSYSSFIDNMILSALFIRFALKRKNMRGQSVSIAVFKLIGTLSASFATYLQLDNTFFIVAGAVCLILDIIYTGILIYYKKHTSFEIKKYRGIKF